MDLLGRKRKGDRKEAEDTALTSLASAADSILERIPLFKAPSLCRSVAGVARQGDDIMSAYSGSR
jgi:hypothetical protein